MSVAAVTQFVNGGTGFVLSRHTKSVSAERLETASSAVVTVRLMHYLMMRIKESGPVNQTINVTRAGLWSCPIILRGRGAGRLWINRPRVGRARHRIVGPSHGWR